MISLYYWVFEAIIDSFFFFEAGFIQELFNPGVHELWMRSIIASLTIAFGIYAQYSVNRIRESEDRTQMLYSLLLSIRNVNQLIVQESDLDELLQKSADILLETRGYIDTYIAIRREEEIVPVAHSGSHERDEWSIKPDGEGEAPRCVREVLEEKSIKVVESTEEYCQYCEFCNHGSDHKTVLLPMLRNESVVGFFSTCMELYRWVDEEEKALLEEITNDLAYAREKILAEEERREAERKRQFLDNLLRQDLMSKNQITTGYLQLLEDEDLSEECKNYLENALDNTYNAVNIIEEVKKLREIEEIEDIGETNIARTLGELIESKEPFAEEGEVEIETDLKGYQGNVIGDYSLESVFQNLIKVRTQSEAGKIRISLEDRGEEVLVKVEDNGRRVPDRIKKSISEATYTGETVGIGGFRYYIVKELVEHNKGSMEVKDSDMGGARFEIYLDKSA